MLRRPGGQGGDPLLGCVAQACALEEKMFLLGGRKRAMSAVMILTGSKPSFLSIPTGGQALKDRHVKLVFSIVTEVDGAELAVYTGDDKAGTRLVDALVQCSLRQMLDSGFFHADPHAGNLLATDDGRLCYLDFGMMSYLEERQRVSIIEAVVHLVNRDFEALADLYVRMGFIKAGTDVKPIVRGLQDALPDVLDAPVSELNVKNVASRLGAISAF